MTKEEQQLIAIEIDKYFRNPTINSKWFSEHIKLEIERPDDGFEPQIMSKIQINQDSIKLIKDNQFRFSGIATVLFEDNVSKLGNHAKVEFGGQASIDGVSDRIWVKDVVLTSFHLTTNIIPKE